MPADIEFTDTMKIDLGGIECILMHAKGPHSDDRVICYIPKEKFVFLGDSNGKDLYGKPWHFDIEHEDSLKNCLVDMNKFHCFDLGKKCATIFYEKFVAKNMIKNSYCIFA